ncbi:FMN-binding protein [Rubritalea sp.]|uniref:FMN-binding protein n=1 Tax=Rubritalea sp. TaxID=2109375 RepID=UPI003EF1A023
MNPLSRRSALKKSLLTTGAFLAGSGFTFAKTYLSTEQAKNLIFPGEKITQKTVTLTKEQMKSIKASSRVRVSRNTINAYKTSSGAWFIVDQVYGKHEFIDFAIGITASGKVKGLEILTYRESYGHEVRNPKWRAQLHGQTINSPCKIDKDVKNISGATLSAVHITDGTRRLLHTWNQILKNL